MLVISAGINKMLVRISNETDPDRSLGRAAKCLTAYMCLTADPGVVSLISAGFYTFVEIDHEIISMAILLPSADSRRVVASYK